MAAITVVDAQEREGRGRDIGTSGERDIGTSGLRDFE
jgi:hypothetical protein